MARGRGTLGRRENENVSSRRKRTANTRQVNTKADKSDAVLDTSSDSIPQSKSQDLVLLSLQQSILDVFFLTFRELLDPSRIDTTLYVLLQEVKQHLYNRDFDAAFGRRDYLEVYAVRWSASRALGYIDILREAIELLIPKSGVGGNAASLNVLSLEDSDKSPTHLEIACLGGGAAELCALAGVNQLRSLSDTDDETSSLTTPLDIQVRLLDVADWSSIVSMLSQSLTLPRPVSPYTSTETKADAIVSLISPDHIRPTFHQIDLLSPAFENNSPFGTADLITLTFTLNELYNKSLSKTQSFLLELTAAAKAGALLLVVDSPGSYSTVTINGTEKRYPMLWLLEHTLMKLAPKALASAAADDGEPSSSTTSTSTPSRSQPTISKASGSHPDLTPQLPPAWTCVTSTASRWFRLPKGLTYPLELENMRYQMHMYRRL